MQPAGTNGFYLAQAGASGLAAFHVVGGEHLDMTPPRFPVEMGFRRWLGASGEDKEAAQDCEALAHHAGFLRNI